jgi:hypothetical protein|tara:strand:+ start:1865 stop:2140 length:276 start_codon:yes stop_codon:yes gene_type:complete
MKMKTVTQSQVVALNMAINLLSHSESDHAEQCVFHLKKLAEMVTPVKKCDNCKCEVKTLFAPFDEGEELYCSDCQMEVENDINENNDHNWE